jgi:hypothetical protein
MRIFNFITSLLLGAALAIAAPRLARGTDQEDKSHGPSPAAHIECKFADGGTISVGYASPRVRGRKIFGEVVPYEQVWSPGNNEATTLVVSEHVHVAPLDGGIDIPAGSYTLFLIPRKDKPWTLIISRKTSERGAPYSGKQYDLGRSEMGSDLVSPPVENFTIGCYQVGPVVMMSMKWDTQAAYVKILDESWIGKQP